MGDAPSRAQEPEASVRCRMAFHLLPLTKGKIVALERRDDLLLVMTESDGVVDRKLGLSVAEARDFAKAIYRLCRRVERRLASGTHDGATPQNPTPNPKASHDQ